MLGQVPPELVKAVLPRSALVADPGLGHPQRARLKAAGANPAHLLGPDQVARLEHLYVLHNRRQ